MHNDLEGAKKRDFKEKQGRKSSVGINNIEIDKTKHLMAITQCHKPPPEILAGILMPISRSITERQRTILAEPMSISQGIRFIQKSLQGGYTPVKDVTSTIQRSLLSIIYCHKQNHNTKTKDIIHQAYGSNMTVRQETHHLKAFYSLVLMHVSCP